jgi:hypothetical protein
MKKIGIIILLTAIIMQGFSQQLSAESQNRKKQGTAVNANENTKVTIGKDLLSIEESDSSLKLRVGNRGLNILESLEGPKFNFEKFTENDEWNQDDAESDHARRRNRFKGHWSGIEFGFNNYLTSDKSLVMPSEIEYMTLHSGKSCNFNINFSQLSLGLTRHIGFVTGLGFNWNNYRFDGNNNILKGTNGIIEELPLDPGVTLEKSKLATVYLNLPFMLEIQIPVDNSHLNVAAGPIGAVKIGSHTKMVFQDRQKVKENGDFSLNMLRYGATARVGYGNFQLYGTYYNTPLFRTGKGPAGNDLYPFEIGVAFTFND